MPTTKEIRKDIDATLETLQTIAKTLAEYDEQLVLLQNQKNQTMAEFHAHQGILRYLQSKLPPPEEDDSLPTYDIKDIEFEDPEIKKQLMGL